MAMVLLLSVVAVAPASGTAPPGTPAAEEFAVRVVSSAPDQVTGGDARLHVSVPQTVPLHQAEVLVNGTDQRDHFNQIPGTRVLSGVIDGLALGETVEPRSNMNGLPLFESILVVLLIIVCGLLPSTSVF